MLNPAVVFAWYTLSIEPIPVALASFVVVVPPFAFQFQATYVWLDWFVLPSSSEVNPSVPKAVKEELESVSALAKSELSKFVTPLLLSKSAWEDVELLSLIQTQSGWNPTPVIAWVPPFPV